MSDAIPKERGSVRPVILQGDPKSYYCEVRTLPRSGLRPKDIVWVDFGTLNKVEGQWRQCEVIPTPANAEGGGATIYVKLSPDPKKAPTELG